MDQSPEPSPASPDAVQPPLQSPVQPAQPTLGRRLLQMGLVLSPAALAVVLSFAPQDRPPNEIVLSTHEASSAEFEFTEVFAESLAQQLDWTIHVAPAKGGAEGAASLLGLELADLALVRIDNTTLPSASDGVSIVAPVAVADDGLLVLMAGPSTHAALVVQLGEALAQGSFRVALGLSEVAPGLPAALQSHLDPRPFGQDADGRRRLLYLGPVITLVLLFALAVQRRRRA